MDDGPTRMEVFFLKLTKHKHGHENSLTSYLSLLESSKKKTLMMQTSHFPLRYLQGSCKNGGHLRVWDRLWIFSKKLDVGHQQLTKALKNLALPRKGGSGIVTFVRPHQSFFRGQLVKVVGEVLTCCLRYGRPMDKGIPWGPPVKNSLIREGPAAPKKNLVSLFFVAMRNLYPFFFDRKSPDF